jgi:hypothetical protein
MVASHTPIPIGLTTDVATEQTLLVGVTVLTALVIGVAIFEYLRQRGWSGAEQSNALTSASPAEDERSETRATT